MLVPYALIYSKYGELREVNFVRIDEDTHELTRNSLDVTFRNVDYTDSKPIYNFGMDRIYLEVEDTITCEFVNCGVRDVSKFIDTPNGLELIPGTNPVEQIIRGIDNRLYYLFDDGTIELITHVDDYVLNRSSEARLASETSFSVSLFIDIKNSKTLNTASDLALEDSSYITTWGDNNTHVFYPMKLPSECLLPNFMPFCFVDCEFRKLYFGDKQVMPLWVEFGDEVSLVKLPKWSKSLVAVLNNNPDIEIIYPEFAHHFVYSTAFLRAHGNFHIGDINADYATLVLGSILLSYKYDSYKPVADAPPTLTTGTIRAKKAVSLLLYNLIIEDFLNIDYSAPVAYIGMTIPRSGNYPIRFKSPLTNILIGRSDRFPDLGRLCCELVAIEHNSRVVHIVCECINQLFVLRLRDFHDIDTLIIDVIHYEWREYNDYNIARFFDYQLENPEISCCIDNDNDFISCRVNIILANCNISELRVHSSQSISTELFCEDSIIATKKLSSNITIN